MSVHRDLLFLLLFLLFFGGLTTALISYKIRTDKVIREYEEQIDACNRRFQFIEQRQKRYETDPFEAAWEEFLWEESCRLYPV